MKKDDKGQAREHEFGEELQEVQPSEERLGVAQLQNVKLTLTADLGRCKLLVRDVLELKRGSVLHLDKLAGEMADIQLNGVPLAKGEVVVLVDSLNLRIAEVLGATDRDMMGEE